MDCARVESVGAQSKERKGSNFAIWQPCMRSSNVWETGAVTALLLLLLSLGPSNSADDPGAAAGGDKLRPRRHTPFMPEDHWKGPPEFGETEANLSVMVNGTAELRCPIARVQDSAVSEEYFIRHAKEGQTNVTFYVEILRGTFPSC